MKPKQEVQIRLNAQKKASRLLNKIVPFEKWIKTPRSECQVLMYNKIKTELENIINHEK